MRRTHKPLAGILLRRHLDNCINRRWLFVKRRDRLRHDAVNNRLKRFAPKRLTPTEHLKEHQAKRENVCARIHHRAADLLRCHIRWRAKDLTRDRNRLLTKHPRDAEVGDLDRAIREEVDVIRLDIPVDNLPRMRILNGIA